MGIMAPLIGFLADKQYHIIMDDAPGIPLRIFNIIF